MTTIVDPGYRSVSRTMATLNRISMKESFSGTTRFYRRLSGWQAKRHPQADDVSCPSDRLPRCARSPEPTELAKKIWGVQPTYCHRLHASFIVRTNTVHASLFPPVVSTPPASPPHNLAAPSSSIHHPAHYHISPLANSLIR